MADLISLFTAKLEETKTSLMSADDMARVHRLQGRAEVLNDFLEAIKESPSVLERLK